VLRAGQTGRTPQHRARFDLRALVAEQVALATTQRHLKPEALRLIGTTDPAPSIDVFGDRLELGSAVMNLIDNAVKYSGDQVDVEIEVVGHGRLASVRVTDRGPGLHADELKRVFRRFYRVPGALTQRVKGTGLGLYIVHTAARRHGGRAYATSNGAGTGTTFHLDLPQAREGVV